MATELIRIPSAMSVISCDFGIITPQHEEQVVTHERGEMPLDKRRGSTLALGVAH